MDDIIKQAVLKCMPNAIIGLLRNIKRYPEDQKILENLLLEGVPRALDFDMNKFAKSVLSYVDSMNVGTCSYRFSASSSKPTLYASVYACMLYGLFNNLEENKKEWIEFFDSYQCSDGLFRDRECLNDLFENGDGWGARHLAGHIIIAYHRLGAVPKQDFKFLEPLLNCDTLLKWLDNMNYRYIWRTSNVIMNYGILMQYARDYMGNKKAGYAVIAIQEWLLSNIREDCGVWFDRRLENLDDVLEACRGAYHLYPILLYDNIPIPYMDKAVETFMKTQNKWGGFDKEIRSSACADIDVLDPLLRLSILSSYRVDEVKKIVLRALPWVLSNQNLDGGFVFSRASQFAYGGHANLSSKPDESNLFGTWFRTLAVLYMEKYLFNRSVNFANIPGYEMPLPKFNVR